MSFVDGISLAVDAGLLVLIWVVQLVVYPGFAYYMGDGLNKWHGKYTMRITVIVFPLMTAQLILGMMDAYYAWNWISALRLMLILATWASTFIQFVPLHNKLTITSDPAGVISLLVRKNWLRTFLWSAIFILSVVHVLLQI